MDYFQTFIGVAMLSAVVGLLLYVGGYAFSLGYHRGKREFIARMIRDNCNKEG